MASTEIIMPSIFSPRRNNTDATYLRREVGSWIGLTLEALLEEMNLRFSCQLTTGLADRFSSRPLSSFDPARSPKQLAESSI